MHKVKYLFVLLYLLCNFISKAQDINAKTLKQTVWEEEEIVEGIVWKYKHFPFLFNGKQFINILEIDLDNKKYELEFAHKEKDLIFVSEFAKEKKAILAINGGFFNIEKAMSVCFLKIKDKIINYTQSKDSIWYYNDAAALSIDVQNNFKILYKQDWQNWLNVATENVMSTGPILIKNGEVCTWQKYDLAHSRTAVGIRQNKLIFLTVDGKTFQSKGLTINNLAILMHSIGCENAINLDGGHSSTMWIQDKNIVNHPSKNRAFDHNGATKVANAILVIKRD